VLQNIGNKVIIFPLPTSQSVALKRQLLTVLLIVYSFKFRLSQNDKISEEKKTEHHYHTYIDLGEKALELRCC